MEVLLAQPRGFCAGVIRAIDIVNRALDAYDEPVYVLHEIVHNRHVVEELRSRGARFVTRLEEVPAGALIVFSAHGVARSVSVDAGRRGLRVIDATCPLVKKVHLQAQRYAREGREVLVIGHRGHPEVEGTRGQVDGPVQVLFGAEEVENLRVRDPSLLAYVTQTTLSVDDTRAVLRELKERFPGIKGPDLKDICYATQSRQNAVHELARRVDILLVVGARYSSNSNRLREVGEHANLPSHLVEEAADIRPEWLEGRRTVGITAGASTPEILVEGVIERLRQLGYGPVTEMEGEREKALFRLPKFP